MLSKWTVLSVYWHALAPVHTSTFTIHNIINGDLQPRQTAVCGAERWQVLYSPQGVRE